MTVQESPTELSTDHLCPHAYELEAVTRFYGNREVLRIDGISIQKGEILAIVGPSGAGKSTLLRLLALLEAPSSGTVRLHLQDRTVTHQTANVADRRHLTMVFQRPLLLSRTVRANVAYGLNLRGETNVNTRVEEALRRVDMLHLADARPYTLSGGEMQRVSIARALVLDPQVLLLDEPTANLDPYNVRIIEELVQWQNERANTTVVMVTHNIFQAKRLAHRVGLILDGRLIEVAPVDVFFNTPNDPRTHAFLNGDIIY